MTESNWTELFIDGGLLLIVLIPYLCWSCYQAGDQAGWNRGFGKRCEIDRVYTKFCSDTEIRKRPVRLSSFALENKMSGDEATQWLDDRIKEFSGIKEITPSGDYLYYFGEAADKKAEEQMKLLDEA